jgi:EAL domain-containing protein (putative c-di-GMP-specific phosphodiesterase class I)
VVCSVTLLTNSLKFIIHPNDLDASHRLHRLGFRSIPSVPQLFYRAVESRQLSQVFLQVSQALSEKSLTSSRYCITRSPLDSTALLIEFLDAPSLSTITDSVKHAWFLQVLAKQQLFFNYQPIFDLQQGHVVAYECLARAISDQGGYFNGQQLIDAALSMDLTREFDELARASCFQAIAQVLASHFTTSQTPPRFFINILPNAITTDIHSLEQSFQQVLDLGVQPQQIVFELTEVEALVNCPQLRQIVAELRRWGFRFAIDDLCGSASTDHFFMEFRPDVIKLDRQLVAGCSRYHLKQILLKSLLQSAHELGISVLAEGLEDFEDIAFCRDLGVDYGQGFGLALPERTPRLHSLESLKLSNAC